MENTIPVDTNINLTLKAGAVKYLLEMLENIQAPRKETDLVYIPILQQWQTQFSKVDKKLKIAEKKKSN